MNPFTEALKVLDERGWHQGDLESEDGRVCAMGALGKVCPQYRLGSSDVLFWVEHQFGLPDTERLTPLAAFNDDPATSEEDVRLLFKHAAEAWDERPANRPSANVDTEGS
jgi:hypothetical protein